MFQPAFPPILSAIHNESIPVRILRRSPQPSQELLINLPTEKELEGMDLIKP